MQDSQQAKTPAASRRGFFFGAAAAGAAATAVAVLPKVVGDPAVAVAAPEPKPAPERGGGYSLSEHVKHYYRTTSA